MNDQLARGVMENDGKESYFNHIQGGANLIYNVSLHQSIVDTHSLSLSLSLEREVEKAQLVLIQIES